MVGFQDATAESCGAAFGSPFVSFGKGDHLPAAQLRQVSLYDACVQSQQDLRKPWLCERILSRIDEPGAWNHLARRGRRERVP
jgi:hypothetical protein